MIDEESRQEDNPQQPVSNSTANDPENASENLDTPADNARRQFEEIKEALIGVEPEWLIPRVDFRALASEP